MKIKCLGFMKIRMRFCVKFLVCGYMSFFYFFDIFIDIWGLEVVLGGWVVFFGCMFFCIYWFYIGDLNRISGMWILVIFFEI